MRTSPLPNRHAADLSDFFETVQATLNRNRAKGDLDCMKPSEIIQKIKEEGGELVGAMRMESLERRFGTRVENAHHDVEQEAADLAVCALAAWLWARKQGKA